MRQLADKVAVVTGASRGIGRAVALGLASRGAAVVINYYSGSAAAAETLAAVEGTGGKGMLFQADVADANACEAMVSAALDNFGRIDILVNNAGITRDNILARMRQDEWQSVLDTNLTGAFNCTKAVLRPLLRQKTGGRIINISSVVGLSGSAGQANYAAAKAGLLGMTKSLARELASRQITVNAVAPGFIATEMTAVLPATLQEGMLSKVPLGRVGTAEEVAEAVIFLAEAGTYITGQVITVDGGLLMF
jgi:3-oxoacyl-[acyl-carrier protein] reductase